MSSSSLFHRPDPPSTLSLTEEEGEDEDGWQEARELNEGTLALDARALADPERPACPTSLAIDSTSTSPPSSPSPSSNSVRPSSGVRREQREALADHTMKRGAPSLRRQISLEVFEREKADQAESERESERGVERDDGPLSSSPMETSEGLMGHFQRLFHLSPRHFSLPLRAADLSHLHPLNVHSERREEGPVVSSCSLAQTLVPTFTPVWCVAMSHDNLFLATGGQDGVVRLYVVVHEENRAILSDLDARARASAMKTFTTAISSEQCIVHPLPYRTFAAHSADITSLSWSSSQFLLSSSLDRTVRLWHTQRAICLSAFSHIDFVTACWFHPIDERTFFSTSMDNKLRAWMITSHRVTHWSQTQQPLTAVTVHVETLTVAAGDSKGDISLFTDELKFIATLHCRNRRGKLKNSGAKVSGLCFHGERLLLVSTNDSRLRLFDWISLQQLCKFKGMQNNNLQLRAEMNEKLLVCPSEDGSAYIWNVSTLLDDLASNGHENLINRHRKFSVQDSVRPLNRQLVHAHAVTVTKCVASSLVESIQRRVQALHGSINVDECLLVASNTGEVSFLLLSIKSVVT